MADADDTRTGEMLGGRYKVGALVGKGGHGEVYRARDTVDGREVAVKFLAAHLAQDNDYRVRLAREARAMSSLNGVGTLEVMGILGAEDGTPCLVMELLEGCDLAEAIASRNRLRVRFNLDEVVTLFSKVVSTLEAVHALGITHRDLKPSNIYLVGRKMHDPRIMDFGLAKVSDMQQITADRMLAGSPSYVAPEIWMRGARNADHRADVYSLAVVIFETLTGDVPIHRKNLGEMLMAVTRPGNIPSLQKIRQDLPADIDDWSKQAFAIKPEERFQSVVGMWRAFRAIVGK
ncbi:MAG: serine/threonine protein kinase [Deltaproteobacteria bacterium]|nr:serine/threonine protein kinase [Deltaproteobacteria bacterium]